MECQLLVEVGVQFADELRNQKLCHEYTHPMTLKFRKKASRVDATKGTPHCAQVWHNIIARG